MLRRPALRFTSAGLPIRRRKALADAGGYAANPQSVRRHAVVRNTKGTTSTISRVPPAIVQAAHHGFHRLGGPYPHTGREIGLWDSARQSSAHATSKDRGRSGRGARRGSIARRASALLPRHARRSVSERAPNGPARDCRSRRRMMTRRTSPANRLRAIKLRRSGAIRPESGIGAAAMHPRIARPSRGFTRNGRPPPHKRTDRHCRKCRPRRRPR